MNDITRIPQLWWGYLHTSGTLQAKRYFTVEAIIEAEQSPFCKLIIKPFEASNREKALSIIESRVNEITNNNN